jgi:anti-sigma B factor antagonist
MNATVTELDGYTLAKLDGPLGDDASAILDKQLHTVIEQPNAQLLVDLSGAIRASSSGLSALVTLVTRANAKGCRVVFCDPSPFLSSIFEVTKLNKLFEIEPSIEAGAARLKG